MRTRFMVTSKALINPRGSRQEPTNQQRRTFIGGALGGLLASPVLASPVLASDRRDEQLDTPNDPFILLLTGIYKPVVNGPNLNLNGINLSDGSYSVTRIYPIFGIGNEGGQIDQDKA